MHKEDVKRWGAPSLEQFIFLGPRTPTRFWCMINKLLTTNPYLNQWVSFIKILQNLQLLKRHEIGRAYSNKRLFIIYSIYIYIYIRISPRDVFPNGHVAKCQIHVIRRLWFPGSCMGAKVQIIETEIRDFQNCMQITLF